MGILSILFSLVSLACWVIILIDTFKDEVWKGIVGLLCGLYLLYYALVEFDHERKWLIVGVWILSSVLSVVFRLSAGGLTPR